MDKRQARAFEAFVAESGDALMRLAVSLTSDQGVAEDMVQETLQRVATRWDRVVSPAGFCRKTLRNLVIDWRRAASRRPREAARPAPVDSADPRSGDPHAAIEVRPALLAALDSLTELQRSVVVLRYLDDRGESEVADLLDVSVGTVKSTASRAVANLKRHPDLTGLFNAESIH